ncbi:hypothetical protein RFI_17180 [Reticulomyxa filosa]|uniref:Caspase family p20 domain-containing protein n=1 Tax=Reticulomyxa filosa TaxID=46433 RepID=X6N299_RETFI|nr:hypothetical protein RFI_17180 [Reticulomyxa filosa]|eukprot:ETO20038.1 hypothetical protein RFI_17180 [Reticulomyxa filosa]
MKLFDLRIDPIIEQVDAMLSKNQRVLSEELKYMCLIGEFGKSHYLQFKLKQHYESSFVLKIPVRPNLAVIEGAHQLRTVPSFRIVANDCNEQNIIWTAYLTINDRKESICLHNLSLKELLSQVVQCLNDEECENMLKMKMDVVDMNFGVIKSNEDVYKSEYDSLENVKDDLANFRELFETTLKYEFVCKDKLKMTKVDAQEFLDKVIYKSKLRRNANGYDGLIFILSGHGDDGDVLATSEGDSLSIDKIRSDFNCEEMSSLKDIPKIFIINACRGKKMPKSHIIGMRGRPEDTKQRLYHGHNDYGFFTIWSTTKGHIVNDSLLFSKCTKEVIVEMCKEGYSLNQMLHEIRNSYSKKFCIALFAKRGTNLGLLLKFTFPKKKKYFVKIFPVQLQNTSLSFKFWQKSSKYSSDSDLLSPFFGSNKFDVGGCF